MTINNLPLVSTTQSQSTENCELELETAGWSNMPPEFSHYPGDTLAKRLVEWIMPEPWMVECLRMNPNFLVWGPYDDYMNKDDGGGYDNRIIYETWKDFGPWELDDYNEVVNFYFEIERKTEVCKSCEKSGLNKNAKTLFDAWESNDKTIFEHYLTQIEVKAFWEHNFLKKIFKVEPTSEQIFAWSKTRLGKKELDYWLWCEIPTITDGYFSNCKNCKGYGRNFTEPETKLGLVLWVLHPRKGASCGIHIKQIRKNELPDVIDFLQRAAQRNSERFSKVVQSI